jgi:hypothetical protein
VRSSLPTRDARLLLRYQRFRQHQAQQSVFTSNCRLRTLGNLVPSWSGDWTPPPRSTRCHRQNRQFLRCRSHSQVRPFPAPFRFKSTWQRQPPEKSRPTQRDFLSQLSRCRSRIYPSQSLPPTPFRCESVMSPFVLSKLTRTGSRTFPHRNRVPHGRTSRLEFPLKTPSSSVHILTNAEELNHDCQHRWPVSGGRSPPAFHNARTAPSMTFCRRRLFSGADVTNDCRRSHRLGFGMPHDESAMNTEEATLRS